MKVFVRMYCIKDEGRTIFICEDAGHISACLKSYFDPCVHPAIDGLAKALIAGQPISDFEAYLGISVVPFFVEKEY